MIYKDNEGLYQYLIENNLIESAFDGKMIEIAGYKLHKKLPKNKYYYYIRYCKSLSQWHIKKYILDIDIDLKKFRSMKVGYIHYFLCRYSNLLEIYKKLNKYNKYNFYLKKAIFSYDRLLSYDRLREINYFQKKILINYYYLLYKYLDYIKINYKMCDYLFFILKK